jgi:hypothetical protein
MSKKDKIKIREDGTVAGCYGTGNPIWPNRCEDCALHSDCVCPSESDNLTRQAKEPKKNGRH